MGGRLGALPSGACQARARRQRAGRGLLLESRALFEAIADEWGVALALYGLGTIASAQGDTEQAVALLDTV